MNDEDMSGPKAQAEWEAVIQVLELFFGVRNHKLSKYVIILSSTSVSFQPLTTSRSEGIVRPSGCQDPHRGVFHGVVVSSY